MCLSNYLVTVSYSLLIFTNIDLFTGLQAETDWSYLGNWAYLASIKCKHQSCMGSLIHNDWILTSASCIRGLEEPCHIELKFMNANERPHIYHVDMIIIHPDFKKFLMKKYSFNDIALVKMKPHPNKFRDSDIAHLARNGLSRPTQCRVPNLMHDNSFFDYTINTKDFNCDYFISVLGNDQIPKEDQVIIASTNFCNKFGFIMLKEKGFDIEGNGQPLICGGEQYAIFLNSFLINNEPNCTQWTFTWTYYNWIQASISEQTVHEDIVPYTTMTPSHRTLGHYIATGRPILMTGISLRKMEAFDMKGNGGNSEVMTEDYYNYFLKKRADLRDPRKYKLPEYVKGLGVTKKFTGKKPIQNPRSNSNKLMSSFILHCFGCNVALLLGFSTVF